MVEHEQENVNLRKRIAELEERLARHEHLGGGGSVESAGVAATARLFEAALGQLSDGVVIADHNGRLVHFNAAAVSMFGCDAKDANSSESITTGICDQKSGRRLPQSEWPLARALAGEHIDGMKFFVRTGTRLDGFHIQCSTRRIYGDQHELQGVVIVCRDIEERQQIDAERVQRLAVEKQSAKMANMLQALLDNLDLVVWAIDEKGVFTFHDGRGTDISGVPRGSIIGQKVFDIFPTTSAIHRALGGVPDHEITETRKQTWETWYVPVQDHVGAPWNVIGLSLNVTETHKAKAELEAKLALIERQQAVIADLETPIIQVWDRILTLPMVGTVDSRRAARVTDDLLNQVSRTQALFAILDLTGVEVVDTATAGHMLNIIAAIRLLGAEGIITGIRPNVAQTVISLGVDLSHVRTLGTLRDGLAFAIRRLAEREAATKVPILQSMQHDSA